MKGLFRYLSPFSPDQSGAVSVLFELGGIIVILDAGGCTGNICGFDEPRWFSKKSAVYSAGLRDIDAILGRDDKLLGKLKDAAETVDADFIALVGTPVPSVIATDYGAVCRLAEKQYGIPAVYIETTGMDDYDKGQKLAYEQILKLLKRCRDDRRKGLDTPAAGLAAKLEEQAEKSADGKLVSGNAKKADGNDKTSAGTSLAGQKFIGIWGATPLDLPAEDSAKALRSRIAEKYPGTVPVTYGMDSGLAELYFAQNAVRNAVCSVSGLEPARALEKMGIPMDTGFFLNDEEKPSGTEGSGKRVLLVHQQIMACSIRNWMRKKWPGLQIDCASFFQMDKAFMEENDVKMDSENDWISLIKERDYDIIAGDPIFKRAVFFWNGDYVPAPQYAVSGGMYAAESDKAYWENLKRGLTEAVEK
ncbi:MAG: nitrogenase component 1 [Eubacterium sp.]